MRKKLLHVIESAAGGALQYVIDLCNNLPGDKWEIEIVYSRRDLTPIDLEELFNDGIKLTKINMTRQISFKKDWAAYRKLHSKFREREWDLIHLHSSKAGALGRLAARGLKVPIIYTPHGFSFYQQDVNAFKRKIYYGLEKLIDRIWRTEILVSSFNEFVDAQRITKSNRVKRISNSVTIPGIESKSSYSELLVITVGRITSAKNPYLFLEIAEEVKRENPSVKFVWVGDGELRQVIESEIRKRNLPVTITGWLSREEVSDWYRRSNIYIQTSQWEGLPLSVLEAMSYGCTPVVSDIPAHRELVDEGANGYIAESANEFKGFITKLIDSPVLNQKMGESARLKVKNDYNLELFETNINDYYFKTIEFYYIRNSSEDTNPKRFIMGEGGLYGNRKN